MAGKSIQNSSIVIFYQLHSFLIAGIDGEHFNFQCLHVMQYGIDCIDDFLNSITFYTSFVCLSFI